MTYKRNDPDSIAARERLSAVNDIEDYKEELRVAKSDKKQAEKTLRKLGVEEALWDDREEWFANDGIDYRTERLEAV